MRRDGVAQIENVEVNAEFRERGLGRAIVQHALDEAQQDAGLVFLEALADDWPRELYAKLGFVTVDRVDVYTRLPDPLSRLRLRTPRLELRVATRAEARRLFEVAEAGIHDPTVMPFEIPWTDALDEEDFVSHVTGSTADSIRFVAFLDGAPIGVQAVDIHPEWVSTGSWLGQAYQGRGLGTEMRAAVLTYAFDVRQAPLARSGAIAGNPQSLGVSRKLGYEVVGTHLVSPRGSPVEHTDVELRRDRFRSPVPVSVDGVQPAVVDSPDKPTRRQRWRRCSCPARGTGIPCRRRRTCARSRPRSSRTTSRHSHGRRRICGARTEWCSSATWR